MKSVLKNLFIYHFAPLILILLSMSTSLYLYQFESNRVFYEALPLSVVNGSEVFGNRTSWLTAMICIAWAYLWLVLTRSYHYGPKVNCLTVPEYKAYGDLYYFTTLLLVILVFSFYPMLATTMYANAKLNIRTLNTIALILCFYLFFRGKLVKEEELDTYLATNRYPFLFEFFRGMDLHPTLFRVNVKQLVVVRLGMMMWQLLIVIYFLANLELNRYFDYGHFASVILQSVYIYKTFHLEHVLVTMIDMTHDRAGYYLCWGSLVWMPAFNAYLSYYLVNNKTHLTPTGALLTIAFGLCAIWFNYDVLRQKLSFREGLLLGKEIKIWGKPAKFVKVIYQVEEDGTSKTKFGSLLISGWWGMARKMNYFWETVAIIIWSFPGYHLGLRSYLYLIFMVGLFVQRTFREDAKCREKYGTGWDIYCSKVPYRMIPYLF